MLLFELLNFENPVFRSYCAWSSILVIKMFTLAFFTIYRQMMYKGGKRYVNNNNNDGFPGVWDWLSYHVFMVSTGSLDQVELTIWKSSKIYTQVWILR
jgi:hypothetical protein